MKPFLSDKSFIMQGIRHQYHSEIIKQYQIRFNFREQYQLINLLRKKVEVVGGSEP